MRYFISILLCCFVLTGAKSFSSSSRSSFSSSKSSFSSSKSFSSGSSRSSFSSSPSKSFSNGSSSKSFSSSSSSSTPKPTMSRSFDSKASTAVKVDQSKTAYQNSTKPSSSGSFFSSRSSGTTYYRPVMSEPKVQQEKQQNFYRTYYSNPTYTRVVHEHHYNDSINPFFMLWLLDRSSDERALWAYHHKNEIDQERYNELLAKDANLEKKIKELENKGIKKDKDYKPEGIDNDLMYATEEKKESWPWGSIFLSLLGIAGLGFLFWYLCFKKTYKAN